MNEMHSCLNPYLCIINDCKIVGKGKSLFDKLKGRYKVMVLEDETFVEKASFKVPLWVLISSTLAFFLFVFVLFTLLLRFTSLKEYIIGEDQVTNRRELMKAYDRIDSLNQISIANELYLSNLQKVIDGTAGENIEEAIKRDSEQIANNSQVENSAPKSMKDQKYSEDEEVLRSLLELRTPVLSQENNDELKERGMASYSFYSPVKGMVTGSFDQETRHFATDIATKMNEPIQSVLDGYVVFASFTPATGYVIIIQHANNLISVYKHCAALLKKEGTFVRGGEVIALVGNTGELSTGPHLHFELWHNGNAVNAEDYINF
jgi:murein DD-endopeptidase MepM/ murein hydrolase activator NlpD